MAQNEEVTYELLVFNGRIWEAQGTYGLSEHSIAVKDGKSLAKVSTIKGVKVVKEVYNKETGETRSLTVYEHKPPKPNDPIIDERKPRKKKKKQSSAASMTGDVRGKKDTPKEEPAKASGWGTSFLGVTIKLMLAIAFSLGAAMVVTQLASIAVRSVRTIGLLNKEDFLVVVFVLVFVITALTLVTRILVGLKRLAPLMARSRRQTPPKPARYKFDKRLTPSADTFRKEREEQEEKDKTPEDPAEQPQADKDTDQEQAEREKAEQEAQVKAKAEEEARQKAAQEAEKKAEVDALSEIVIMNAFTKDAFDLLQGDKSKQDAHTVFGLVLFLVGAVQALGRQHKLGDDVVNTVARNALGSLGLSKDRITHFIQHTDEYLISNPRYSQMFQSGRAAMGTYLDREVGPRGALSDALDDWDKPKASAETTNQPVTVLFTDIAGSTAMTQKLGDVGAQEVVRAHNDIVRGAIKAFAGKEVKHTGDGIMASFPSAAAGVGAALDMQKRTKDHNATDPSHPLGLKIGLNAGEPIAEDDDLFGTTVQLAARIVDKAASGQVLVSGSVHGLSHGKGFKFERFADFDMKGFDEAITVYQVLWEDAPAKPDASAPKPEIAEANRTPEAAAKAPEPTLAQKAEEAAKPQPAPADAPKSEPKDELEAKPEDAPAPPQSVEKGAGEKGEDLPDQAETALTSAPPATPKEPASADAAEKPTKPNA